MDPLLAELEIEGRRYHFVDVASLGEDYIDLPYCLRILVESALRNARLETDPNVSDVWTQVGRHLLSHRSASDPSDILFQPGRVVLQDFTGVAALVDLAAIRDAVALSGGDPSEVDAKCPADLVIDHCVQVDFSQIETAIQKEDASKESNLCQMFRNMTTAPAAPTLIVHSTFPPPPTQIAPYYVTGPAPPPAFYPGFCSHPPPPPPPQFITATMRTSAVPSVPRDNPGLPIQEDICPFHQRISHWSTFLRQNRSSEMERNQERFQFLKWVDSAFQKVTVIPPGTGVMHKVNLEYLARVVTCKEHDGMTILFPDSLIGTDAHTTIVNGLGVLGWSVGTLEAESVMFGHPVTLKLPKIIGVELTGVVPPMATSTDVVLLVTKQLRRNNFTGDIFVEFFGPGVRLLSITDRSAIANMCLEYGSLVGYFPIDEQTIEYLGHTGRDSHQLRCIETYMKKVSLFRKSNEANVCKYDSVISIDLSDVLPCVSGPKSSKDKVPLYQVPQHFRAMVQTRQGKQILGVLGPDENPVAGTSFSIGVDSRIFTIGHGTILTASIASCSNASNPGVMLSAGLLAKKSVEAGLSVAKFVRRSLCPGSGIVTAYLQESGVMPYLHMLGFEVMGYGCSACVENSNKPVLAAETDGPLMEAIRQRSLVCVGVYSGNRNFEGRLNPDIKANYLISPQLVIAYAIAGRIDIDFEREPIGFSNSNNKPVYLSEIWPSQKEVQQVENRFVIPAIFRQVPTRLAFGTKEWSQLEVPKGTEGLFKWNQSSTYIRSPQYIEDMMSNGPQKANLTQMRCLLKLEDDVSSDFISPAGSIVRNSPAADYLSERGQVARQFNSYGARRGNWEVMARGTFAHPKLKNILTKKLGPYTVHFPSCVPTTIYDASQMYVKEQVNTLVVAGDNFGRGAARDWATKGPYLLGVRVVLATSFYPTFRANLVKIGILPLKIDRSFYTEVKGCETFEIKIPPKDSLGPKSSIEVRVTSGNRTNTRMAEAQLENDYEVKLYQDGGIICQMAKSLKSTQ